MGAGTEQQFYRASTRFLRRSSLSAIAVFRCHGGGRYGDRVCVRAGVREGRFAGLIRYSVARLLRRIAPVRFSADADGRADNSSNGSQNTTMVPTSDASGFRGLIVFFSARRYASAVLHGYGRHVSKRLNRLSWFLVERLPSTCSIHRVVRQEIEEFR